MTITDINKIQSAMRSQNVAPSIIDSAEDLEWANSVNRSLGQDEFWQMGDRYYVVAQQTLYLVPACES